MIQLFHINKHTIDTSEFSNLLHDDVVTEFEDKIAKYVGAKYACSINSATNAIFLSLLNKDVVVDLPSMIPPVVANAILTSGNKINFIDDVNWVGHSYTLHQFDDYKIVDSAQRLEENQFKNECNPNDLMLFSFYPTKPLGGSDGGMIVTDDYEKYKWFKEAVLNGMTYANNNWERKISFPGYKMYMNSIQAQICLNKELGYNNSSSHLYRIEVSDNQRFINRMREDNIICGMHYSALHLNPIYNKGIIFECPKSEKLQSITVSLPMNENLIDEDVHYIIEKVRKNI